MRRGGRAFWLNLVREYEAGRGNGEPQRQFAARHGVKLSTFRSWLYRRSREDGADEVAPRLLPVRVIASTAPTARQQGEADVAAIEAELPSGMRVRFAAALGAELIADVLRRLG